MGCNCSAGSTIQTARQSGQAVVLLGQVNSSVPCEYLPDQLKNWRIKLLCVKEKGIWVDLGITASKLNKYIGVVLSAINYTTNPCYFKTQLDEIASFMAVIINNETC